MKKRFLLLICVAFIFSCDYFKQEEIGEPVARVNEKYLYKKDLDNLLFKNTTKEDSIVIVTNFINRWATQQLLIDQSLINLPLNQQEEFNKLVEEYKVGLFTEAYKSTIISSQLDTLVTDTQLENYYLENKDNFKLNDELLKVRFIQVEKNYNNIADLKKKLERFNKKDQEALENLSIKFKNFNLNDSIWIKNDKLLDALPILQNKKSQMLKKSNFIEMQDSIGVYLVKIEDVLKTYDIAPLSYIKPTIKQIILNRRKRELIKTLEKDITVDAIKNKSFEIYK